MAGKLVTVSRSCCSSHGESAPWDIEHLARSRSNSESSTCYCAGCQAILKGLCFDRGVCGHDDRTNVNRRCIPRLTAIGGISNRGFRCGTIKRHILDSVICSPRRTESGSGNRYWQIIRFSSFFSLQLITRISANARSIRYQAFSIFITGLFLLKYYFLWFENQTHFPRSSILLYFINAYMLQITKRRKRVWSTRGFSLY